jgi:D-alanyl-lipoteichoic acid acyltransferase DltB (MBOAT superfamily)
MMPQFSEGKTYRFSVENMAVGTTIFLAGLFKKVVLADGIAAYATPVFNAAATGLPPSFFESWIGALAYTLQLYFDFSGYSDMAIGLARMFGIIFPVNFHSPYKALNMIAFWRRWHMTLSRFLRDYLYFALGGNRNGKVRRYVNLMITMVLGGLWHGAGWTFVFWGGLHGLYLVVNHFWRNLREAMGQDLTHSTGVGRATSRAVTFLAVVLAWVFFRATSFHAATVLLAAMFHPAGTTVATTNLIDDEAVAAGWIAVLLLLVWFAPNTQEWMARFHPTLDPNFARTSDSTRYPVWQMTVPWAVVTGIIGGISIVALSRTSEFLYFQF